jgi:hypothetical protein
MISGVNARCLSFIGSGQEDVCDTLALNFRRKHLLGVDVRRVLLEAPERKVTKRPKEVGGVRNEAPHVNVLLVGQRDHQWIEVRCHLSSEKSIAVIPG